MKSLLYVIITLYMLNYVFSTDCVEIEPKKASDCTDHELTEKDKEEYPDVDSCCYQSIVVKGTTTIKCDVFYTSSLERYIEYLQGMKENKDIDDFTLICPESDSDSDSDSSPGPGSDDSGSIWLSLSLSFLIFGLLF